MVAEVAGAFGGVDVLVNAAARPASSAAVPSLAELTDEALRVEVETKVLGYLRCARAVAPHMAAAGWGRIVNVSGLNARTSGSLVGSVRNVAVAARAARDGLTVEEAACRLAAAASIGRLVTAEEVADVVTFLASPRSAAITSDAIAVGGGTRGAILY